MNSTDTHPYDATTVIRPAEMPLLCREDEATWSLHLDVGTVVFLEDDQVRRMVDDHLSQIVGGPFELGEIPDEATFTDAARTIALRVRADLTAADAEFRESTVRELGPELARVLSPADYETWLRRMQPA